jgi:hypothetical protein
MLIGWGARIRTWEWRNQNQLDYPTISKRILEKTTKTGSSDFNRLPAVSKMKMARAGRIRRQQSRHSRDRAALARLVALTYRTLE